MLTIQLIMKNWKLITYSLAALLLLLAAWTVNHWRVKASELDAARLEVETLKNEAARNETIAIEREKSIEKIRTDARKYRQAVIRDLGNDVAYRGAIPAGGLQYLRDAAKPPG